MPNILAARIDNRLIHGQVGMTWVNSLQANLILVANDKVSEDTVQQSLMDMVVPNGVQTRYFSVEKNAKVINKASDRQKILLVVKDVIDVKRLRDLGLRIDTWIVGNMHFSEGKKQITSTVSLDEEQIGIFKELIQDKISFIIKGIPSDAGQDLSKLI